jgi:hypothetical protein
MPQFSLASVLKVGGAQAFTSYPIGNMDGFFQLVLALLSMAALRTVENVGWVAREGQRFFSAGAVTDKGRN